MPAESPGARLVLRGVDKVYDSDHVVRDVSLEVEAGEFVTLLGPSGSGKTTTLNMIAGFVEATAGEIELDGRPIEGLAPHKRGIGMVFQQYALFPTMTVRQNIAFPLRRRRMAKAEIRRRVDEVLELIDLSGYGDRVPAQLSGGQQQRVALGRAIAFKPRLLLMDEPLGALDRNLREALQFEIKSLHRDVGITFLYVTHDQDEALALSDRIAVFNAGRIDQVGTPTQLYEEPATLFVARFLGESNVFSGTVERSGAQRVLAGEGCRLDCPAHDGPTGAGSLVVRPERIRMGPSGSGAGGPNVLNGLVRDSVYLGPTRRVEVTLPSGQVVVVRQPAAMPPVADEGQPVEVSWDRDDARLLMEPAAAAPAAEEPVLAEERS